MIERKRRPNDRMPGSNGAIAWARLAIAEGRAPQVRGDSIASLLKSTAGRFGSFRSLCRLPPGARQRALASQRVRADAPPVSPPALLLVYLQARPPFSPLQIAIWLVLLDGSSTSRLRQDMLTSRWRAATAGHPSPKDYFVGDVKNAEGTTLGPLTMKLVSSLLRPLQDLPA